MINQVLICILPAPDGIKDQLPLALCTSCGEMANPYPSGTETLMDWLHRKFRTRRYFGKEKMNTSYGTLNHYCS